MASVRIRPVRASDLAALSVNFLADADPWNFFGFRATNELEPLRQTACPRTSALAVETADGRLLGDVSRAISASRRTPAAPSTSGSRCPNIRAGSRARRRRRRCQLPDHARPAARAITDVENIAERRESRLPARGVLRHAQYRAGAWRDAVSTAGCAEAGRSPDGPRRRTPTCAAAITSAAENHRRARGPHPACRPSPRPRCRTPAGRGHDLRVAGSCRPCGHQAPSVVSPIPSGSGRGRCRR
jgi:hypothetical protein